MVGRKKAPICPWCGKALYRTPKPKIKRTTILYSFCRNEACKLFGDITRHGYCPGTSNTPGVSPGTRASVKKKATNDEKRHRVDSPIPTKGKVQGKKKRRRKAVRAPVDNPWPLEKMTGKAPKPLCARCGKNSVNCSCESESVVNARKKINKVIVDTPKQKVDEMKSITAMSVVVMLQGLGDNDVADILIVRYGLGKYGLKKGKENDERK